MSRTLEHTPIPAGAGARRCERATGLPKLAIVVVTYKRQEMLVDLFASIEALDPAPWRIVIIDNENAPATERIVDGFNERVRARRAGGADEPDALGNTDLMVYMPQEENLGGAGGFSMGVRRAFELGAEWFWVMDDDVTVLPGAIERLERWTGRFEVIQPARLDYDGGPFYWQYRFITALGIPNPLAPADLGEDGWRPMNQLCFEGGLFSRRVVKKIGFPDARYFIYGDDAVYGYLASKVCDCAVVEDVVLRRARDISNWDIAGVRQLNSTSDTNRYYIMRNRGFTARYMQLHGDYNRLGFALGTAATFCKELIRLAAVDRTFKTGIPALVRGMRDARKILRDRTWQPVPAIEEQAAR